MENEIDTERDSLPPMTSDAQPVTLPPRPRNRRQTWIMGLIILQVATIMAGALTYWLLIDPLLSEYRRFGLLLASFTFLSCGTSTVVNYLLFQEIKSRKR